MKRITRFTAFTAGIFTIVLSSFSGAKAAAKTQVRVVIWDERQPAQKQAYANFLGNEIAAYLQNHARLKNGQPEWTVKSVGLDDPDQGLPKELLDNTDILIWWGHQRHGDVKDELANDIVKRVQEGKLRLMSLHSAHWSKPFRYAMQVLSKEAALKSLSPGDRENVTVQTLPPDMRLMDRKERLTPYWDLTTGADGKKTLVVKLPSCVFPFVAAEGKPSHITILLKNHPITRGVPEKFDIPQTECYGGPFHVPHPDLQFLEEKWDNGESFPGGCVWKLGKGMVFYFRPGHETYPIFKQAEPLRIIENTVRWLAGGAK